MRLFRRCSSKKEEVDVVRHNLRRTKRRDQYYIACWILLNFIASIFFSCCVVNIAVYFPSPRNRTDVYE